MQSKLIIQNVLKSYNKKSVLSNISCSISRGEIVGLFGPNGSGKTTLFSIIIGLIKSDLGQILLNNQDITLLPMYLRAKLGIGYLPQESSVFKGLSVEDNIKAILEIVYNDKQEIAAKCDKLLHKFLISHLKDHQSSYLSGGERRRLEIARSLASNPKYILLDEPLAGIDPIAVDDIKQLIKSLKKDKIGVLITDHNVRDTLDIVDRAYIIYRGTILMEGTAPEIINSNKVKKFYLGRSFEE